MAHKEGTPIVYVVDDEPAIRDSLQVLLKAVRLTTRTFASASEFLAATISRPACLLLDIRMPELDGFQLQKRIAGTDHDIPIIVITSFALAGDEQKARDAGASAYLAKPYSPRELLQLIRQLAPES